MIAALAIAVILSNLAVLIMACANAVNARRIDQTIDSSPNVTRMDGYRYRVRVGRGANLDVVA